MSDRMVKALVHRLIRANPCLESDRDDLLQVGRIAAWLAEKHYDPSRGSLGSYLWPAIKHALWKHARGQSRHVHVELPDNLPAPMPTVFEAKLLVDVQRLPIRGKHAAKKRDVLIRYLSGENGASIARHYGCSKQAIHELIKRARVDFDKWRIRLGYV